MKAVAICAVLGGAVFLAGLLQMGVLRQAGLGFAEESAKSEKKAPPKAKYPDALVPAAQARAVPEATFYKPGPHTHKMAIMTPTGELHAWNDELPDAWLADNVEETELVIVIGKHRSTMVERVHYRNGTPVDRIKWELEVSVVEAKTGRVLENRVFINMPRDGRNYEVAAITKIGCQVHWKTVFDWVTKKSKSGFPEDADAAPIITVID